MKKYFLFSLFIIILGSLIILGIYHASKQENVEENGTSASEETSTISEKNDLIRVEKPASGEEVKNPLEISGMARGQWFFEASFLIRLVNTEGKTLGTAVAMAEGEWMTEKFVPFKAVLSFDPIDATEGRLIFEKANPSGLPEHDDSFEMSVRFSQEKTMTVRAFFGHEKSNEKMDCGAVYPLERTVARKKAIERAAIEQLLAGITDEEKTRGYFTSINPGVELEALSIQHGVAFIYFDEKLEEAVGGSCRVTSIRAQIEETLKQFPTVDKVIISIDGRSEDILQP